MIEGKSATSVLPRILARRRAGSEPMIHLSLRALLQVLDMTTSIAHPCLHVSSVRLRSNEWSFGFD